MIIKPEKRTVYVAPTAGRAYMSKAAAYNNEAKARFFARCECEAGGWEEPGSTCDLHWPDGKYLTRRESDGTTLTGRIIRRWARLLRAADKAAKP